MLPSALERRRQEALERYLAGDPIAVICREMGCAKSWLYTWKNRYQVTEPDWFQEYSRRPETTPTKTPDALEAQIVQLRHTLSPDGLGTVSAGVIRDHLRHHGAKSIPSRRTIYRIIKRQAKEGTHTLSPRKSQVVSGISEVGKFQLLLTVSKPARLEGRWRREVPTLKEAARPLGVR